MLKATNPVDGSLVREVPCDSPQRVDEKLERAISAYANWRRTSFEQRADALRAVARELRADVDRLAAVMTEEMGKTVREARGEIEKCAGCAEHFADNARGYLADEPIDSDATRSYVRYLPLGVVLGILPWNSPFWLAFRVCAPALMAGNAVILKHDSHVPGCAVAVAEVFVRAGLPAGVMDVLLIDSSTLEPVVRDDRVAAISLTGSTRAGAIVAAQAAAGIKPAVMELGGSDPCVVLADADLEDAAVTAALSRLIAVGQSCIAAKRLIVEDSVYDRFEQLLRARLEAVRVGDPTDPATDMGPMARVDLRDDLHQLVETSVKQGARLVLGGVVPEGPGAFYPVTLLADVTADMSVFREETFGPVAVLVRARDVEHAIALANDTPYGLAASIWTSPERGEQLASEIEAGQVVVNGLVKTDPRLPSGGIKRSGYGKELGPQGIRMFVNAQQVWVGPKRTT